MNNSLIADPHQRKLLKKWGAILESGKKIQSESTKIALAQVLENTCNYYKMKGMLNEAGIHQGDVTGGYTKGKGVLTGDDNVPYANGTAGDFYLPNVVMPMLRRIMPDLIANDLVGVQPLNGPVGYALAYRLDYACGRHVRIQRGRPLRNGDSQFQAVLLSAVAWTVI